MRFLLCVWEVGRQVDGVCVKEEEGLVFGTKFLILQGSRKSVEEVQLKVLEAAVLVVRSMLGILHLKRPRFLSA